jgi:hypothetical protein
MADLWKTAGRRGVRAGHVDDRGHGVGAAGGNTTEERRRAVRAVLASAADADDARLLLDMLGLDVAELGEETAA